MIFVSDAAVRATVTPLNMRTAIADAFRVFDDGDGNVFPFVSGHGALATDRIGVKFGRDSALGFVGIKAGSYFASNHSRGLPTHASTVLLIDQVTAQPVAVVAATYLNGLRTAAANALATDLLARRDAGVLTVFGAGGQAFHEVTAISLVRDLDHVIVVARTPGSVSAATLATRITAELGIKASVEGAESASRQADIIVTVTPSRSAIVEHGWIRPGTHVSAMGADGPGKQELDIELVANADVYVDYGAQARTLGECQHAYAAARIDNDRLERFTLGALLNGKVPGRTDDDAVTLFDSSGIAIQDIAAAALAVRLSVAADLAVDVT